MQKKYLKNVVALILEVEGVNSILYGVLFFTAVCNILMLVPSIYMLQVYDRVLTSFDTNTLYALSLIALYLYIVFSLLDHIRAQVVTVISTKLENIHSQSLSQALTEPRFSQRMMGKYYVGELNTLKNFIAGGPLLAIIDAPWAVVFIITVFLIHETLGIFVVLTVISLILLTYINIRMTHSGIDTAKKVSDVERLLISDVLGSRESITAMGMKRNIIFFLQSARLDYTRLVDSTSLIVGRLATIGKFLRLVSQSAILAVGAYLAILNEITAGAMIAASILAGRALQPIEGIIQVVKTAREAEQSAVFIRSMDQAQKGDPTPSIELPNPKESVSLVDVSYDYPENSTGVLRNISLTVKSGEILGLIGPSGSGKSTLLKIMAGVISPTSGSVLYDGFDFSKYSQEKRGMFIGYQSQSTELLAGTLASNISRFTGPDSTAVINAAKLSGAHDFIAELKEAYDYKLRPGGLGLSEGQRKRLALARAYYREPAFIFLDEPSNALDEKSISLLLSSLKDLQETGKLVVVSTHNPKLLSVTHRTAVLMEGRLTMLDKTDRVIRAFTR